MTKPEPQPRSPKVCALKPKRGKPKQRPLGGALPSGWMGPERYALLAGCDYTLLPSRQRHSAGALAVASWDKGLGQNHILQGTLRTLG